MKLVANEPQRAQCVPHVNSSRFLNECRRSAAKTHLNVEKYFHFHLNANSTHNILVKHRKIPAFYVFTEADQFPADQKKNGEFAQEITLDTC